MHKGFLRAGALQPACCVLLVLSAEICTCQELDKYCSSRTGSPLLLSPRVSPFFQTN